MVKNNKISSQDFYSRKKSVLFFICSLLFPLIGPVFQGLLICSSLHFSSSNCQRENAALVHLSVSFFSFTNIFQVINFPGNPPLTSTGFHYYMIFNHTVSSNFLPCNHIWSYPSMWNIGLWPHLVNIPIVCLNPPSTAPSFPEPFYKCWCLSVNFPLYHFILYHNSTKQNTHSFICVICLIKVKNLQICKDHTREVLVCLYCDIQWQVYIQWQPGHLLNVTHAKKIAFLSGYSKQRYLAQPHLHLQEHTLSSHIVLLWVGVLKIIFTIFTESCIIKTTDQQDIPFFLMLQCG